MIKQPTVEYYVKKGATTGYKPRHKFNAQITERNGIKFRSQKEAEYYDMLCMRQRQRDVVFFLMQTKFHLPGNVTYSCDFQVFYPDGSVQFIDVKGKRTKGYIRNKKMVEALYPVIIHER